MTRIYKYIVVAVLLLACHIGYAQMKSVKGTVLDEANLPLPGTSVIVQGTQRGVITDENGAYEIAATADEILDRKSVV